MATIVDRKNISVADGKKTKSFNVAQIFRHQPLVRDPQTQRNLTRIFDNAINSVEVLESTDSGFESESN